MSMTKLEELEKAHDTAFSAYIAALKGEEKK